MLFLQFLFSSLWISWVMLVKSVSPKPTAAFTSTSFHCCATNKPTFLVKGSRTAITVIHDTNTNTNSRSLNACTGRSTSTTLYSSNSLYFNQENLNPKTLIAKGMQAFQQGKIQESIQYFDEADSLVPNEKLSPYLWQRGISLYYVNAFQEASHQFQLDVKVNPLDVEEIVWDIASQNRLYSSSSSSSTSLSSPRYLSLPPGKMDRRKIMNVIYSLFRNENGVKEQDLIYAGSHGSISDEFYSLFYLGLYCESIGETSKASYYMRAATQTEYATGRGASDYMTSCARVHCQLRHWI